VTRKSDDLFNLPIFSALVETFHFAASKSADSYEMLSYVLSFVFVFCWQNNSCKYCALL